MSRTEFTDETFTTREAREMIQDADEQETSRIAGQRRRNGANVEDPRRAAKGHKTPAQTARAAQSPKRENPVAWRPAAALDAPPAPPGMVLRWVRQKLGSGGDAKNVSRKLREGWRPYLLQDAPEGYIPPDKSQTEHGTVISVQDLILCMMPREMWKQRQAFYRNKRDRQTEAVSNKFRDQEDPRLKISREYKQTSSRPRRAPVQSDEE